MITKNDITHIIPAVSIGLTLETDRQSMKINKHDDDDLDFTTN
jgi:hypothetical protein